MYRHTFDAISFFFGLLFTAGALSAMLVDDPWPFDRGGVWAVMLIVGGLLLLVAAVRPGGDRRQLAVALPQAAPSATDPVLVAARREIDEYVGTAVPSETAPDDTVTGEILGDEAGSAEIDGDEPETAEVVAEDAEGSPDGPEASGEGPDGARP